jgi:hypothetical protein
MKDVGNFYGHLVNFWVILGTLYQEKSGNPGRRQSDIS